MVGRNYSNGDQCPCASIALTCKTMLSEEDEMADITVCFQKYTELSNGHCNFEKKEKEKKIEMQRKCLFLIC